ncbi:MAG: hypothetical protein HKM93_20960, partial [Desulfobacteraceae bacterium]|nr:hypothetical protein [Desulfobacteraceae bacterium]
MIITCNECTTSYNLDDSLIKADGSKVRCTNCQTVFTAFPQTPVSEPEHPSADSSEDQAMETQNDNAGDTEDDLPPFYDFPDNLAETKSPGISEETPVES